MEGADVPWVVLLLQALRARRGGFLPHHRRDDGVPRDGESDQVRSTPTRTLSRALRSCESTGPTASARPSF